MDLVAVLTWTDLAPFWPHLLGLAALLIDLTATAHAILHKRDTRAAIGWVAIIWLVPGIGFALYIWLGINRIERRAKRLLGSQTVAQRQLLHCACRPAELDEHLLPYGEPIRRLADYMHHITQQPILHGNQAEPLDGADETYPAMLQAIEGARVSVALCVYIFDAGVNGQRFVAALGRAVARGVQVRVLIDDIGARYHVPAIDGSLEALGIRFARFLPSLMPLSLRYSNLRNHRKILVVDGQIGFTGGMNIRDVELRDFHFRLTGPIVCQMQQVFADDWAFTTHETLSGTKWFPVLEPVGKIFARGIADGPDENFDRLRMTILGGLASAVRRITIWTPYFLPDSALITALNVAALRGVEVNIILPEDNNLALVQWASTALLGQLIEQGCRIWYSPPPFDHTKLMIVDEVWVLLGSGNWDPRSLRLNFEFNIECYSPPLAKHLETLTRATLEHCRRIRLADIRGRSLARQLRDGVAGLFSPYL
ncbi:MAG TPA: phospholipase D-like domain-containing protein [Pirellulales bacterium]|jgi:cardiolipin synthase|nr:phospholipase D-like domain-containing protein [Pirellulales bacterium]